MMTIAVRFLAVVLLAASASAAAAQSDSRTAGTYEMIRAPRCIRDAVPSADIRQGARMVLQRDGRLVIALQSDFNVDHRCGRYMSDARQVYLGRYHRTSEGFAFTINGFAEPLFHRAVGDTLSWNGFVWVRTSSRVDPETLTLWRMYTDSHAEEALATRRAIAADFMATLDSGPYKCQGDPLLAVEIPTADTAGLGALVASTDPSYRPAGPGDLACSGFQDAAAFEIAGMHPTHLMAEFGSAYGWWILWGDFDGDDVTDRLLPVNGVAAPLTEMPTFMVLFGAGGHAFVPVSSWPWVVEAGLEVATCAGARYFEVDVIRSELGSFYWGGEALLSLGDADLHCGKEY